MDLPYDEYLERLKQRAVETQRELDSILKHPFIEATWGELRDIFCGTGDGLKMTMAHATSSEYERYSSPIVAYHTLNVPSSTWVVKLTATTLFPFENLLYPEFSHRPTEILKSKKTDGHWSVFLDVDLFPIWLKEPDGQSFMWADEPFAKGEVFTFSYSDGSKEIMELTSDPRRAASVVSFSDPSGDLVNVSFLDSDFHFEGLKTSHLRDMGRAIDAGLLLLDLAAKNYTSDRFNLRGARNVRVLDVKKGEASCSSPLV